MHLQGTKTEKSLDLKLSYFYVSPSTGHYISESTMWTVNYNELVHETVFGMLL